MKMPHPDMDPQWPACTDGLLMTPGTPVASKACSDYLRTDGWCEHIREYLIKAQDADDITFGTRIIVPIVPQHGHYAEVSIDSEAIAEMLAKIALVREDNAFTMDEELIGLGLYTKGEGRLVIANSVADWISQFVDETCKFARHSFPQEMALQQAEKAAPGKPKEEFYKCNRWCLAYHKMCWPCFQNELRAEKNVPDLTGDFGMGEVGVPRSTARQNNTLNQLNARFRNRTVTQVSPNAWPPIGVGVERDVPL